MKSWEIRKRELTPAEYLNLRREIGEARAARNARARQRTGGKSEGVAMTTERETCRTQTGKNSARS